MNNRAFCIVRRSCCIAVAVLALTLPSPRAATGSSPDDPLASRLVSLVNAHRASLSRAPLLWDQRLADVAQAHTEDMVNRGFFSHTNPDGETFAMRLRNANITFISASENIAAGFSTAEAVFSAWLLSPGHRSNIESAAFTHHGIGYYQTYWTHNFIEAPTSPVGVDDTEPGERGVRMTAFPSPARSSSRVRFTLAAPGHVTLRIVDVSGREAARPLNDEVRDAGSHEVALAVQDYDPGLYFLLLEVGPFRSTTRILVVR